MTIETLKQALEALELASSCVDGYYVPKGKTMLPEVESAITALRTAITEAESRASEQAEKQEPVAWVDLLKEADEIVRSKPLWKKFIDGTPLANDIAVWMANFAHEHTTPPAAQRQWVGLTDEQMVDAIEPLYQNRATAEMAAKVSIDEFRAIEAKLKEKNGGVV